MLENQLKGVILIEDLMQFDNVGVPQLLEDGDFTDGRGWYPLLRDCKFDLFECVIGNLFR